jgi:glutathione S-transferase
MKLYTHHHSANGRKVLASSHHLKLDPEIILVNIYQGDGQKPDYLKINPFGKIPFDDFPALKNWYENIESLDAWKKSESELWVIQ